MAQAGTAPSLLEVAVVVLIGAAAIWLGSEPSGHGLLLLWFPLVPGIDTRGTTLAEVVAPIVRLALIAPFVAYIVRFPAALGWWWYTRGAGGEADGRRWRWCVAPLCAALLISIHVTAWPLRVRFEASRAALDSAARDFAASGQAGELPRWIGFYRVRGIGRFYHTHAVFFKTGDGIGGVEGAGFVFDPAGARPGELDELCAGWSWRGYFAWR